MILAPRNRLAFQSWTSCDISSNLKHLTDMHGCVFVCVWDKQLLCTPGPNPGLRMAAAHGLMEHSHLLLHSTELASAGSSRCALRDPHHACACLGIFFRSLAQLTSHMSAFSFPVFTLFHLCSNYLSLCRWNIAARSPLKPVTWLTLEVMERTRMERADSPSHWPHKLGSITVWPLISSGNGVD